LHPERAAPGDESHKAGFAMNDVEPLDLDVRAELRTGGEPLPRIMQAVRSLRPGQSLRLRATFEPLPLYAVLGRKGFAHEAVRHAQGDWEVRFTPGADPAPAPEAPPRPGDEPDAEWPAASTFLDNRDLVPPEPLVRILEALERLRPGQVLEALNPRDPVFLYPELEKRGAAIRTRAENDGVRLFIRRGEGP